MQKNDKSYTFLLSHSSKKKIYIKRVAVRKRYLHFGTVGIFLLLGISALSIGLSGIVRNAASKLSDHYSDRSPAGRNSGNSIRNNRLHTPFNPDRSRSQQRRPG
jgi:hypothetical protein